MLNKKSINILFLIMLISNVACNVPPIKDFVTSTINPTSTVLPTSTFLPTKYPTKTPIPKNRVDKLVFHKATGSITYNWFSYIPSDLDKSKPVYLLVTGLHGGIESYDNQTNITKQMVEERLGWPFINNFILLAPVIPRSADGHEDFYPIAFDLPSFTTTNLFYRRADIEFNHILDYFTESLQNDGYRVNPKILIEGFSAGGVFAQRYALLHPEKVLAISAGGISNFSLPITEYEDIPVNWPVGIANIEYLAQINFDEKEYKNIYQYIFIGEQDSKYPNTLLFPNSWGPTSMWESVEQRNFLRRAFGSQDPLRIEKQINYLNKNGYEKITFKKYPDVGHEFNSLMVNDIMNFLKNTIEINNEYLQGFQPTSLITIDGYKNEWSNYEIKVVPRGDSSNISTDNISYSYTQDEYYIYIMVETKKPIIDDPFTIVIGVELSNPDKSNNGFEFNVNSDGTIFAGYFPKTWNQIFGYRVDWKDVIEIQIPKSVFNNSIFEGIKYISL
jgi:pimeloyl-ACP methyl ester carboxylesterase